MADKTRAQYGIWLIAALLLAAAGIFFGIFYSGSPGSLDNSVDVKSQLARSEEIASKNDRVPFSRKTIRQYFTFEKYRQVMIARQENLRSQKNRGDLVDQILLDRQLELLGSEMHDLHANYKKKVNLLFGTGELIFDYKSDMTPAENQKVKRSLLAGDFGPALEVLRALENRYKVSLGGAGFDRAAKVAFQQGRISENDQRLNNAYQSYRRSVKYDPENVEYLLAAGKISDKIALYGKALMYYGAALANLQRKDDTNSINVRNLYVILGKIHYSKGETGKAVEFFEKALQSDQAQEKPVELNLAVDHENLGMAWEARKNNVNAREHYLVAIDLYRRIFGKTHQSTKSVIQKLDSLP